MFVIFATYLKKDKKSFLAFAKTLLKCETILNGSFNAGLKEWKYTVAEVKTINGTNTVFLNNTNNKKLRICQESYLKENEKYILSFTLSGPENGAYAICRNIKTGKEKYIFCKENNKNKRYNWEIVPESSGFYSIYLATDKIGEYYFSNISLKALNSKKLVFFRSIKTLLICSIIIFLTYLFLTRWNKYLEYYILIIVLTISFLTNDFLSFFATLIFCSLLFFTSNVKLGALISLCLLIAYAALKRFYLLGDKCFWWDEFLTEQRVWFSAKEIFHHPMTARCLLYSFILKFYASFLYLFKHNAFLSEFQLRFPHAIVGTLSIFVIYHIGKKLRDSLTGFLLASFATFSYFLIYYAREARFYPFVLLFSACLIHAVTLIVYREEKSCFKTILIYYVYYSIVAVCGMHTHQGFWLLYAASNAFLFSFEILNVCSSSKEKKTVSLLFLIPVFILLVIPLLSSFSSINSLLNKGTESNIISAAKLVPKLDNAFFIKVHNELWLGLKTASIMHFVIIFCAFFLLFFKKTRIMSIYLLAVTIVTFVALRNMGTFKEPFRVKYITFIWLVEAIILVLAFTSFFGYLFIHLERKPITKIIFCLIIATLFLGLQTDIKSTFSFPKKFNDHFFRDAANRIKNNSSDNDIILSSNEGLAALSYYKRAFSVDWKIININSPIGNFVFDGLIYGMFNKKDFSSQNKNLFSELLVGSKGYSLYVSKKQDKFLKDNISFALSSGFTNLKFNKKTWNKDLWYFTTNLVINGNFTNDFLGWKTSSNKLTNYFCASFGNNGLTVTNNLEKPFIMYQTVYIPTNGFYALTFKTSGFSTLGQIRLTSDEIKKNIYSGDLKECLLTKYQEFEFTHPQNLKIDVVINGLGYATIKEIGLYKLEKKDKLTSTIKE